LIFIYVSRLYGYYENIRCAQLNLVVVKTVIIYSFTLTFIYKPYFRHTYVQICFNNNHSGFENMFISQFKLHFQGGFFVFLVELNYKMDRSGRLPTRKCLSRQNIRTSSSRVETIMCVRGRTVRKRDVH